MLLRIPDFYDSFHCIGGKCPDNCCIGWELDIDDDTYEYYRSVQGTFGDRLRENMSGAEESSENESVSFRLQVDGRCPFLNDKNLCDICLDLGPDALCRICTDYPRYSFNAAASGCLFWTRPFCPLAGNAGLCCILQMESLCCGNCCP